MQFSNIDDLISSPARGAKVYKDECAFSFAAPDDEDGIFICLKTFLGIGPMLLAEFSQITGGTIFLHYKIVRKLKDEDILHSQPAKPKRLAIGITGGFELPQDRYTIEERWILTRLPNTDQLEIPCPPKSTDPKKMITSHLENLGLSTKLIRCIATIQCSESAILLAEKESTAKSWEAENLRPISKHALDLVQLDNSVKIPPKGLKCALCDQRTNLWLNLTDGFISCGRRFWDGSGGNNHAIAHYEETGYPLAVKLGTISASEAEVFSYPEDDMVTDPYLARHLAHFGIDSRSMEKTDKTVLELEIEANERLGEWLTLQESDKALKPLYGPGLTGLINLGNTCYINSGLQLLFTLPQFRWRYAHSLAKIRNGAMLSLNSSPAVFPVENFDLQLTKVGEALCSGAFSWPAPESRSESNGDTALKWPGVKPRMFKHLIGEKHTEFASKQQQDVQEFLSVLFSLIDSDLKEKDPFEVTLDSQGTKRIANSPLSALSFTVEDRLQCGESGKVQYSQHNEYILRLPIPVSAATNTEEVTAYEKRQNAPARAGLPRDDNPVYLNVPFEECLLSWAGTQVITDFRSPATNPPFQMTSALHSSRLLNFPDFLCVHMLKFTIGENWLPRKLDVTVQLDRQSRNGKPSTDWFLDLSNLKAGGGLQPNEESMPVFDDVSAVPESQPAADELIIAQLVEMDFNKNAALRACVATSNTGVEAAVDWIMEHLDDADLNNPTESLSLSGSTANVDRVSVVALIDMGITEKRAIRALELCSNDLEQAANLAFSDPEKLDKPVCSIPMSVPGTTSAVETCEMDQSLPSTTGDPRYELIGFISHMGSSTSAGHYVCHVKRSTLSSGIAGIQPAHTPTPLESNDEWVIFNDDKVARSESPPFQHAYMYLFRRVDAPRV